MRIVAAGVGFAAMLVATCLASPPSAIADPPMPCAHVGTVGPDPGGAGYTLCTAAGWIHINRSVCVDYPKLFNCDGTPKM
ncbi:MAG: hypothetical protein QOG19_948 [Mycobacterium sp.]|jgi:hypothetical protein|nr:hypothetical protein [Mycobacterium sp.]